MKNNNNFRLKRTVTGVSCALLLLCNSGFSQDQNPDNTFTLNLKNTDIHSLISTVSKQTGKNFVVDPRVKAKVTVISTDPVGADGLYEVFLSVLQVHGYSAVPAGDLIKIVPDVTAKQGPVPILGDDADSSDQLVTQVVAVINVPAAQLVPILRPMVPQQGHLAAYAATNSLIITDRSSNIQRLMEIIRRIDKPDNEEIEVVRLNHAAASEIVRTLTSLQRNNLGGPQGPGATQMVADERTNSVLISGDRAVRVRMRGLIAHLDTPIESGGNTRVVYLRFANAEDMVNILQGVSQGQAKVGTSASTDGGTGTTLQPTPVVQQPANTGNTPNAAAQIVNQNNNSVRARSAADSGESNVDIQADPNTNALIITAPPDEMQNILAVIRQLDIRRAQVLVEAVIAEITEDNTREFGINFLLDGSDKGVPAGFSNLGDATSGALNIAGALSTRTPPSSLGNGVSLALGQFGSGEIDFGFLVRAIASDADNNILSTPSLMTLDNEEAEIVVGQNVPFVTGTQLSANNNNPFQTIERQDIGLTLKVKPQINDGNSIKMELEQEVSGVNTTALTGASDITTSKRSIKTTVLVEDGQTIVLGGLIDDQIQDVEEKVPLLGDIPFIGRLFRYRSTQKSKQNLMIFLHPRIMRDGESATQFSNSKYNFLRSQQTLYRQEKDNNIRREDDLLPELRLFFKGQPIDSPLTRFDDSPAISTDPVATTRDIDNLAGILARKSVDTSVDNETSADIDLPQVALPSPLPAAQSATKVAETPAMQDRTAAALIGRVDSHNNGTEAQALTVSAVAPAPDVDDATTGNELTDQVAADNNSQAAGTEESALAETDGADLATIIASEPVVADAHKETNAPVTDNADLVSATVDTADEALATNTNTQLEATFVTSLNSDMASGETSVADLMDQAEIISAIPKLPDSSVTTTAASESESGDVEARDLIAMANIWQLGINNSVSTSEEDTFQPEVEIVSITVVDATAHIANESPLGSLGSVQLGGPILPLPGALSANNGEPTRVPRY